MSDDISTQLLTQASENIHKLFELCSRTDERAKGLQTKIKRLQEEIDNIVKQQTLVGKDLAILNNEDVADSLRCQMNSCQVALVEIDRRLSNIEGSVRGSENRWEKVMTFAVQLIWVILAAWLLATLQLQSPP